MRDPWEARLDGSHVHLVEYVVPVLGMATTWLNGYWLRLGLIVVSAALVLFGGLRTIWGTHPPEDGDGRPARRQRRPARARQIRQKRVRLGARMSLVLVLVAGALTAVMTADRANAAFLGVTGTPASIASGNLLTPTSPACRWTSGTALAVTWSLGSGGIQTGAQVIRTTLAGLTPTSVATVTPANVGDRVVHRHHPGHHPLQLRRAHHPVAVDVGAHRQRAQRRVLRRRDRLRRQRHRRVPR